MSFTVRRDSRRHRGGTKDYHLVAILNEDNGRCLLIQRWAKAGQWGTGIKVTPCATGRDLDREWDKVAKVKFRAGEYEGRLPTKGSDHDDLDSLKKNLGQYWPRLGAHAEWLVPGCGMEGKKVEEPAEWDDREKRYVKPRATNPDDFENVEPEPDIEEFVKDNPQWGSW
jgi:hypothetical protein